MEFPGQKIVGELVTWNGGNGLILFSSGDPIVLRFGLVIRELEEVIFPELVLDDWGHEIEFPELFEWIHDNGDRFPRAEVFGLDLAGERVQYFLRELDLTVKLPCYAFEQGAVGFSEPVLVNAILLPERSVTEATRQTPPDDIDLPFRQARVTWWALPGRYPKAGQYT